MIELDEVGIFLFNSVNMVSELFEKKHDARCFFHTRNRRGVDCVLVTRLLARVTAEAWSVSIRYLYHHNQSRRWRDEDRQVVSWFCF